ncbi:MAG: TonB-dependent receptor [Leptospiraceae bacterium]|nr:TonB-dependent receptor [Leptospiraceae bacterium]
MIFSNFFRIFFLTLTFSFSFSIFAQLTPNSRKVLISNFQSMDGKQNSATEKIIQEKMQKKLAESGYEVSQSTGNTIASRLNFAKENNVKFLLEGYYEKKSPESNLNLFVQVYDPNTGKIIDAYSVTDDIYESEGLKLDPKEILEPDESRAEKLSNKISLILRSNPNKKENRSNIESYILPRLVDKTKTYLPSNENSDAKAALEVFDILQSQITVSSTKVAKKTNEAPNIVSVIQNKELQDYGRISINDVLYHLPGFAPSQINDRRTVTSRGMYEGWNNNHLLVLKDGVQFNDAFYGSAYTWEITPLNFVKSMEVIRGPGSALYGSNATNGVVSLNTYSGSDLKGEIRTRVRAGDQGTRITDIMTGNTGKYFSYLVSYNSFQTSGNNYRNFDGSGRTDAFGFLEKFSHKDSRNSYYTFLKLEGEKELKGLSIQYHRQAWNYQTFNGWLQNVPDFNDKLSESRDSYVVKYTKPIGDKLSQEYVFKYADNNWDYNTRFFPNTKDYPVGVWENLKTKLDTFFARAQLTYLLSNGGTIVGGVEGNRTVYNGDIEHNSNYDVNLKGNGTYFPNNAFLPLNPFMDWIYKKPINKFATFAQVSSGRILDKKIEVTIGIRYDETSIRFRGIDIPYGDVLGYPSLNYTDRNSEFSYNYTVPTRYLGAPFVTNEKKTYRKTSPRLGLVFFATSQLTFKAMTGVAFREPAPGELFGVNTLVGGSNNPRKISPEVITTNELAMDYFMNRYLNLRVNLFQTRFQNVIDYNGTSNAVSNVYTLGTRGVETELLVLYKNITGFVNFSRFFRYADNNLDAAISKHPKEVTIAPSTVANFGMTVNYLQFLFSTSVHYQGSVARKTSDLGKIEPITGYLLNNDYSNPYSYPQYRPRVLPAWWNINIRMMYKITEDLQLGFNILNLLNNQQTLIQRSNYPFDYIREERRYLLEFIGNF